MTVIATKQIRGSEMCYEVGNVVAPEHAEALIGARAAITVAPNTADVKIEDNSEKLEAEKLKDEIEAHEENELIDMINMEDDEEAEDDV